MRTSLAFLLLIAAVGVASADIIEALRAVSQQCASENLIPVEDIPKYHNYQFLSTLNAGENSKCYTKCLAERANILTPHGFNAEPYVAYTGASRNRDPSASLEQFNTCISYTPAVYDCSSAWELYTCLWNF